MKISDRKLDQMDGPLKSGSTTKKDRATAFSGESKSSDDVSSAKVKLSERAQDMKKIRNAVDSIPDFDEAKVNKLKDLIAKGQYKVDAQKVADKMVDEFAYNDTLSAKED